MPVGRLRKSSVGRGGEETSRELSARPLRVLVIGGASLERRRICLAGCRAAVGLCEWIEAADAAAASRMLAGSEFDLVLGGSDSLPWHAVSAARPAPVVVAISEDNEPQAIQQMLDAGAECCLPKHLPQRILESELRRLVAQTRLRARLSRCLSRGSQRVTAP
jgi:DNA-binding NarL/FixJ family response regulator